MSILDTLGADAKADATALFASLSQDKVGALAFDAATIMVDGVKTLIDPTDQAQLSAAEAQFLNDLSLAETEVGTIVSTDVQALITLAVQAIASGVVAGAVGSV